MPASVIAKAILSAKWAALADMMDRYRKEVIPGMKMSVSIADIRAAQDELLALSKAAA